MKVLFYGKEHTFLEEDTGLLYRNSSLTQTAPPHTHTFYEVFIVTAGTALHMVNDTIQTLHAGDFVFIRPADVHSYEFHHSDDFRIINVGFSTMIYENIKTFLANDSAFLILEEQELPPTLHLEGNLFETTIAELSRIGACMKKEKPGFTTRLAKCILAQCFVYFLSENESDHSRGKLYPAWFQDMLYEMDKLPNLQEGYPKMLELAACSPNHLSRVFKDFMGQTPTEYINDKRLNYAVYYLTQTTDDILVVCENCGFNNLSHFYHLFKKKCGCSPAKFRKQN